MSQRAPRRQELPDQLFQNLVENVRQSEERFRLLVERVQDYAIFMLDRTGRITTWNVGAERIKGFRADEVLGKQLSIFYTPEDLATGAPQRELEIARTEG